MKEKESIQYLKDVFDNVNKWLSFAEAKNGSIVIFNTTCIVNIIKNIDDKEISISNIWCWILCMFCISLIMALFSFKPNTKSIEAHIMKKRKLNCERNFLFYAHISELSPYEYITKLNNKGIIVKINKIHKDYVDEIIMNSRITVWKYKMFKRSLWISIFGVILIILSQIWGWILWKLNLIFK